MKIFTAEQIRKGDAYTIVHEPIASIDLMERAAKACLEYLLHSTPVNQHILILCGPGNNGGDGLALARLLSERRFNVEVIRCIGQKNPSDDHSINHKRLQGFGIPCHDIRNMDELKSFPDCAVMVDALLGTGLEQAPDDFFSHCIAMMNQSKVRKLSIDIPSGLPADGFTPSRNWSAEKVFKADVTLSFQQPKLAFFMPETGVFCGKVEVLDIGISKTYIQETDTPYVAVTGSNIKEIYRPRPRFSHKGMFGHALLLAGSKGKMGAAILSAKAAMRSGLGLLSVSVPRHQSDLILHHLPEALTMESSHDAVAYEISSANYHAIGAGPGIGTTSDAVQSIHNLIQKGGNLVLDADALNILSENKTWLSYLPQGSILTPHPGEFARLAGKWEFTSESWKKHLDFAKRYQCIVVLKGAFTSIASPAGRIFINTSGNACLAKAGSGDALTGIITALRAQGYSPLNSALLGVYLHGRAADIAVKEKSPAGILAGDVIEKLPYAFAELEH
jgi:ADP-dependent NAD(P)H-hydrate dehydratase / NAD(P)H-hydrate epimerase